MGSMGAYSLEEEEGQENRKSSEEQKSSAQDAGKQVTKNAAPVIHKTKAQLKFEEMREKQQKKRILEKATKTHKQRVEEFNRQLDSLTEHFDIPKVSWTK
nr:EOG090X0P1V [Eulimnadia texana]